MTTGEDDDTPAPAPKPVVLKFGDDEVAALALGGDRFKLTADVGDGRHFRKGDVCTWREGKGWHVILRPVPGLGRDPRPPPTPPPTASKRPSKKDP